jgi:type VI secretion system protein ImpF
MKTLIYSRDRLQPAFLDRLIDKKPENQALESPEDRVMSKVELRRSVLRDLNWLLNSTGGLHNLNRDAYPHVRSSVLNFGLPALSGTLVSKIELSSLEQWIRQAIVDFEPRIVAETLTVRGIEPENPLLHHNALSFEISGQMWAQPYPLDVFFRTSVDLETGSTKVEDPTLLSVDIDLEAEATKVASKKAVQ